MKIYLTHCSAKKDKTLRHSGEKVTPDKLYTATPLKRFIDKCEEQNVHWAIFSDKYGIWFPQEMHEWYEKNPNTVTEQEFKKLVKDFDKKLAKYTEIYFYHNPGRFHPLYRRLLKNVKTKDRLILFTHLAEIKTEQTVSDLCKWQHEQLEQLPFIKFPFNLEKLPKNGIYFFYEQTESWGHGGNKPRIVRVGTHKNGNFRNRIAEHFLFNGTKMNFNNDSPKPSDRSIFRKNIGRALLNKQKDDYLDIWDKDFTSRANKNKFGLLRDIEKEKKIESEITKILRTNFSFKYIKLDDQTERMGKGGLESSLIGTLAQCKLCCPSKVWFGNNSPKKVIRKSGLWLVQHLTSEWMNEHNKKTLLHSISQTKKPKIMEKKSLKKVEPECNKTTEKIREMSGKKSFRSKYFPLQKYLENLDEDKIILKYSEIEQTLGFELPTSAYEHGRWWSNGGHTQANAWLNAGWLVYDINLGNSIIFVKKSSWKNVEIIDGKKIYWFCATPFTQVKKKKHAKNST